MTAFDIAALLLIAVSALVGYVRGFIREVLTVTAFVLAAIVAAYGLKFSGPLFRRLLDPDWFGTALALIVVFVVFYVGLRIAGARLTASIRDVGPLGLIDRIAGGVFGLLRAWVVLGVFYLVLSAVTPRDRMPLWIAEAATAPLARSGALLVTRLTPEGLDAAGRFGPAIEQAVREGASDAPEAAPDDLPPDEVEERTAPDDRPARPSAARAREDRR